jgi:hypothetical protein
MSKMYISEFQQRDYIRAANLAQEGVEIVRNKRDNNLKKTYGSPARPCTAFSTVAPCNFYKVSVNGHVCIGCEDVSPAPSEFTRTIKIEGGDESKAITSIVEWTPRGSTTGKQKITVTDTLWAWGDSE